MLIPLDEARNLIDSTSFKNPKNIEVDLLNAVGKICAEDIYSVQDIPEKDLSAMDGYAIKVSDNKKKLKIRGKLFPSSNDIPEIRDGETYYVTTGAPIPKGAEAVVRIEGVKKEEGDYIIPNIEVHKGKDIREKGEDIRKGEIILRKGEIITPYHLGILSYEKITKVKVLDINFSIFANGDELSPFGDISKTQDSISPVLIPLLSKFGQVKYLGVAKDNEEDVMRHLKNGIESSDYVISIGGSSVGEKDYVKKSISKMGKIIFEGVSTNVLKRGGVGIIEDKPVLVLPGQIVSAITVFHEHGLHIISKMLGSEIRKFEEITLAEGIEVTHNMDSTYLLKEENGKAYPLRWGVGLYSEIYKANMFSVFKRGKKYEPGEKIIAQRFLL
ncbi:molybdopterin molybdenumtransferase MoeA [Acidianus manzaensis]|uniref:Molybdopterin molybdenumtransferase MoeA n=2 Tax=Acidianus manzaensis TaxID=282676 RepID=A0A1W6JZU0_9CREN|nr:molybdopterin molybdenumtransferase MoeA [Acidianus manzaensis]